ncbi:unnamed protein product [Amoebophrya sp. A25]|nr:unnamed protein product [Amoebophrya sp. A25]|eukprot:GSA25T00006483001.1
MVDLVDVHSEIPKEIAIDVTAVREAKAEAAKAAAAARAQQEHQEALSRSRSKLEQSGRGPGSGSVEAPGKEEGSRPKNSPTANANNRETSHSQSGSGSEHGGEESDEDKGRPKSKKEIMRERQRQTGGLGTFAPPVRSLEERLENLIEVAGFQAAVDARVVKRAQSERLPAPVSRYAEARKMILEMDSASDSDQSTPLPDEGGPGEDLHEDVLDGRAGENADAVVENEPQGAFSRSTSTRGRGLRQQDDHQSRTSVSSSQQISSQQQTFVLNRPSSYHGGVGSGSGTRSGRSPQEDPSTARRTAGGTGSGTSGDRRTDSQAGSSMFSRRAGVLSSAAPNVDTMSRPGSASSQQDTLFEINVLRPNSSGRPMSQQSQLQHLATGGEFGLPSSSTTAARGGPSQVLNEQQETASTASYGTRVSDRTRLSTGRDIRGSAPGRHDSPAHQGQQAQAQRSPHQENQLLALPEAAPSVVSSSRRSKKSSTSKKGDRRGLSSSRSRDKLSGSRRSASSGGGSVGAEDPCGDGREDVGAYRGVVWGGKLIAKTLSSDREAKRRARVLNDNSLIPDVEYAEMTMSAKKRRNWEEKVGLTRPTMAELTYSIESRALSGRLGRHLAFGEMLSSGSETELEKARDRVPYDVPSDVEM